MKTLVTGGAGFIGSNVVRLLLEQGEEVKVLHLPNEDLRNLKGMDVELISGNILDKVVVDHAVQGCDKVYHLAAIYAFWLKDPKIMFDVNIEGTRNLLDACIAHKVKKVVHTSSAVRYGGQGLDRTGNEESPFAMEKTGELYSLSKYLSHELTEKYAAEGLNVCIVCPTMPIGPGDVAPTPTGKYVISVTRNPVIFYTDTTTNVGDVRDIARGHLLAMKKGKKGRSYILGGRRNLTMKKFMQACKSTLHKQTPLVKLPQTAFEAIGYALEMTSTFITHKAPPLTSQAARASALGLSLDCSRAIEELGYECRPIEESIKDAFEWFEQNDYL